jgi:acetylornithine deacetylase/succinyl-diaminopimelate desuccinylase-like protein
MSQDFTPHQQKIIKRYYNNQDTIQSQRLAELVSELYLSEGKKREGVWKRIVSALQKLGIPQSRIDHLRKQDNPALIAQVVQDLEKKK